MKPTYEELQAQVEVLRQALSDAQQNIGFLSHHLRGRMGEAALMDMAEKADSWADILNQPPSACLVQVRAEAGLLGYKVGATEHFLHIQSGGGLFGVDQRANQYAERIRQEVK